MGKRPQRRFKSIIGFSQEEIAHIARAFAYLKPYKTIAVIIGLLTVAASLVELIPVYIQKQIIDQAIYHKNVKLLIALSGTAILVPVVQMVMEAVSGYLNTQVSLRMSQNARQNLIDHIQKLGFSFYVYLKIKEQVPYLSRFFEYLDTEPEIKEKISAKAVDSFQGDIRFDSVGFSYRNAENNSTQVFDNLSLSIKAGSTAALVGSSGAGKSTIAKLIPRFYDVDCGTISIDGTDVRDYTLKSLRRRIGTVFQDTYLFNATIRENLLVAKDSASDEELEEAAKAAQIYDFIKQLPDGFDTLVGERGIKLSGGQRQRMAIARILLYDPDILIFDEATASLDSETEIAVTRAMYERLMGKTRIIIAHRLSTVINANIQDAVEMKECYGELQFRNVKFSYNADIPVLEKISFDIKSGHIVALVGLSGSGKSTVADLTPRFYDPDEGEILLDGHNLRTLKLHDLRTHIGFVTQDTFLFNGTVADNIRYGKADATPEEVINAAKAAYIHDLINSLPDKYDTEVGERGTRFSGGQQQRIAIARVILMNPKVLVLDEATSALDVESEKYIQMALDKLMKGRTSLVIAHRLSTVMHADEILVLDSGCIVQCGTHDELMHADGPYKRIYLSQFEKYSEKKN